MGTTSFRISGGGTRPAAPASLPAVSPPAVTAVPAVSDPARLTLPIQAYMPADARLVLLAQAEAVLEKRCMAAAGYDYAPPPVESADGAVSGMTDLRYGIHDLAAARAHGYQPAGDPKDAAAGRALVVAHQKDAGMSDAGRLALFGSRSQGPADPGPSSDAPTHPLSKDGCLAQSTDRVTGGRPCRRLRHPREAAGLPQRA